MTKVVLANGQKPKRARPASALKTRRRRSVDCSIETVYVIEAGRDDVGEQLRTVFQLNVNRARRAKKAAVAAE